MKLFNNLFKASKTPKNIASTIPRKRSGKNQNIDRVIDQIAKSFKDKIWRMETRYIN